MRTNNDVKDLKILHEDNNVYYKNIINIAYRSVNEEDSENIERIICNYFNENEIFYKKFSYEEYQDGILSNIDRYFYTEFNDMKDIHGKSQVVFIVDSFKCLKNTCKETDYFYFMDRLQEIISRWHKKDDLKIIFLNNYNERSAFHYIDFIADSIYYFKCVSSKPYYEVELKKDRMRPCGLTFFVEKEKPEFNGEEKYVKKQVTFTLEETLAKTFTIGVDIPIDKLDRDDWIDYAINKIQSMYKNQELVLTADDFNGVTQIQLQDDKTCTEWFNLF